MDNITTKVKALLEKDINELTKHPEVCAQRPGIDFTRRRTLPLDELIWFLITKGAGTIRHELMEYFSYDPACIPSPSAFCQQKEKLCPKALRELLRSFSSRQELKEYKKEFALVAVDGSSFCFGPDRNDSLTYHSKKAQSVHGYNLVHAVALYDLIGDIYLDAIIQNGREKDEYRAICDLVDGWKRPKDLALHPILLADRGFASYNVFAHLIESGMLFALRAKDQTIKRMMRIPKKDTLADHLDCTINLILSRTIAPTKVAHPDRLDNYRKLYPKVSFDFVSDTHPEYEMTLRIVRFPIEGGFENIVCNLDENTFDEQEIAHIYNLRWGIETSFRDLKQTIGAEKVHSKKAQGVKQEIYARMVLFDFCSMVASFICRLSDVAGKHGRKHAHRINFATCIDVCCAFLRRRTRAPDVEKLIAGSTLPIRPGRSFQRRSRTHYLPRYAYRSA